MPDNTTNSGILTDDSGRWVKGTASPNPGGRPKLTDVQKYLRQAAGEVTEDLFNILIEMACYSQVKSRDKWERIKPAERLRAVELLLAYAHGKPTQHIDAQIESKVLTINLTMPDEIEQEDF